MPLAESEFRDCLSDIKYQSQRKTFGEFSFALIIVPGERMEGDSRKVSAFCELNKVSMVTASILGMIVVAVRCYFTVQPNKFS